MVCHAGQLPHTHERLALPGRAWRAARLAAALGPASAARSTLLDRWGFAAPYALRALLRRMPGYHRYWRKRGPLLFIANLDMDSAPEMPPLLGFRRRVMPWAVEEAKRRYESIAPNDLPPGNTAATGTGQHDALESRPGFKARGNWPRDCRWIRRRGDRPRPTIRRAACPARGRRRSDRSVSRSSAAG